MLARAAFDDRAMWATLGIVLGLKLLLAALLPLTGDESYFVLYARHVDWGGFYDHPPMVGWMLWAMERVGTHPLVLRLPAIITGFALALGLYLLLRGIDPAKARIVALLILLTPAYLINILISSDTGLILFGFTGALVLREAWRRDRLALYAVAGVLLGLAFLSKYFAVLLGVGIAALLPFASRRQVVGLAVLFACVLPFGLLNIVWNYLNCWNHIMFNVYNRNAGGGLEPMGAITYGFTLLYLFALPLWYVVRDRGFIGRELRMRDLWPLPFVGIVPLLVFLGLSLFATIGLHWVLLFVALVYPAYVFLSHDDLDRCLRFMAWFSGLHVLIVLALLLAPVELFRDRDFGRDAVFYLEPDRYAAAIDGFRGDFHATDSYSRSAVLSYYSGRHWSVFGGGGKHAREDDRITDWRKFDGKRMVFVSRSHDIDLADLEPWFDRVRIEPVTIAGSRFDVALADGFDYTEYRDSVLERARARYYAIPRFLPVGGCPFLDRHFGEGGC